MSTYNLYFIFSVPHKKTSGEIPFYGIFPEVTAVMADMGGLSRKFRAPRATPLRWELQASADLLPQSCSMKNGKYIQYSRIFHTFARVKTLAESPCPIMRCCLRNLASCVFSDIGDPDMRTPVQNTSEVFGYPFPGDVRRPFCWGGLFFCLQAEWSHCKMIGGKVQNRRRKGLPRKVQRKTRRCIYSPFQKEMGPVY